MTFSPLSNSPHISKSDSQTVRSSETRIYEKIVAIGNHEYKVSICLDKSFDALSNPEIDKIYGKEIEQLVIQMKAIVDQKKNISINADVINPKSDEENQVFFTSGNEKQNIKNDTAVKLIQVFQNGMRLDLNKNVRAVEARLKQDEDLNNVHLAPLKNKVVQKETNL